MTDPKWTPDQCRAKRWNGHPSYEGPHEPHNFTYGPNDVYMGHCGGRVLGVVLNDNT